MANQQKSHVFVAVNCQCGRSLRAKIELVGTEIRCWDCHKMVLVPALEQPLRVVRELSDNTLAVLKGPGFYPVLILSSIVTATLAIPVYGAWCSVIALALGASAYGETIRRVSRGPVSNSEPIGWSALLPGSVTKAILGLLLAAGLVIPLWILNVGERQSPHLNGAGLAIAAASYLILPLLMLCVYAGDSQGRLPDFRRMLKVLSKYPLATMLAIAVVPSTLVFVEFVLDLFFYLTGHFSFLAMDLMPMPQKPYKPEMYDDIPHYNLVDFRTYDDSKYIMGYIDNLFHGYSFVGAVPASLSNSTRAGINLMVLGLDPWVFFLARLLVAMVIVTSLLTAFTVQARWFGTLLALERAGRPPVLPQPPSSIVPATSN